MIGHNEEPGESRGAEFERVLLVTSQGGHLTHLLALRSWWSPRGRLWVCPPTPDVQDRLSGEEVVSSHHPTTRNVRNLLRNAVLAVRLIRSYRPDVVVSSGAGVAVPFFLVARLCRIPTVFVEVFDRIETASLTGRLCGPLTTTQVVQWEEQRRLYPKAVVVGPLL